MPDQTMSLEQLLPLMQECFANGKTVTFTPSGSSMRPMLQGGRDTVTLMALPETLRKGDVVLYRREDGSFVLHRLLKIAQNCWYFGGDAQFSLEAVEKKQMLALLCAFCRKGKPIRADAPGYRAYVALWSGTRPLRRRLVSLYGRLKRAESASPKR